jgi:hypothetical protein
MDWKYVVNVPQKKFTLETVRWLEQNVSLQQHLWKCEIDMFERRAVYFKNEVDSIKFKEYITTS